MPEQSDFDAMMFQIKHEYDALKAEASTHEGAIVPNFEDYCATKYTQSRLAYNVLLEQRMKEHKESEDAHKRLLSRKDGYINQLQWKSRIAIGLLDSIANSGDYTHAERKGAIRLVRDMLSATRYDSYYSPPDLPDVDGPPF